MTVSEDMAVVKVQLADVVARLRAIEDVVLELRLERARYEWLKKVLWIALGAIVPTALAVAYTWVHVAVSAAVGP